MLRVPLRQHGAAYATAAEAFRSRSGQAPGAEVTLCQCTRFHVARPLRPVPIRARARAKRADVSPETELAIRTRAGNGSPGNAHCEATGVWLGHNGGSVQPRDAGSTEPVRSSLVNLVLLSEAAHGLARCRDGQMGEGGFWLRSGEDPAFTPILLHRGEGPGVRLWLAEDGIGDNGSGYLYAAPVLPGGLL